MIEVDPPTPIKKCTAPLVCDWMRFLSGVAWKQPPLRTLIFKVGIGILLSWKLLN